MRVTIEHLDSHEYPGFVWGKRTVHGIFVKLLIELADDEKHIIDQQNLSHYVIVEVRNPDHYDPVLRRDFKNAPELLPDPTIKYTIGNFCSPDGLTRQFDTLGEAKNWAHELRTHVKKLKDIIDHNSTSGQKETFDL